MLDDNKYLGISSDLVFKNLFGTSKNKRFTIDLLESLLKLNKGSLDESVIKNSVNLDKKTVDNKAFELDVVLKSKNGDIFNIEMQKLLDKSAEVKNYMYLSGLIYGELNRGDNYSQVKKVIQIEFSKDMHRHKSSDVVKHYSMINESNINDRILDDEFKIIIVDIEVKRKARYNDSRFEGWRRLIAAETLEEAKEVVKKFSVKNPLIEDAFKESVRFMNEGYVQNYSMQEKLIKSRMEIIKSEGIELGRNEGIELGRNEGIELGRNEGIELGRNEGIRVEKLKIAKKMMENGKSNEEIIKYTNLSLDELNSLKYL